MVTAMAKPDGEKGGRGKLSQNRESFSKTELNAIAQARYVLRNNFTPEGQQYPDRCFAVMAGTLALTEAYAMTQVDTLRKMAERIQARAIRRCGELLKQVETGQGVRTDLLHDAADMKLTRTEAATQAGLSERQKVTVLRVANTECSRACPPSMLYARLIRTSASTSTCPPSTFPLLPVQQEPAVQASSEPSRAAGYPQRQMSKVSGLSIFPNCFGCLDRSSKASRRARTRAWTVSSVIHRAWPCTSRCSSRCYANT